MMELVGWLAMLFSWSTLFIAGKYRWGWLLNASVACLWVPYGLYMGSAPVIINTIAYAIIAIRNWYVWSKDDKRICDQCASRGRQDDISS